MNRSDRLTANLGREQSQHEAARVAALWHK